MTPAVSDLPVFLLATATHEEQLDIEIPLAKSENGSEDNGSSTMPEVPRHWYAPALVRIVIYLAVVILAYVEGGSRHRPLHSSTHAAVRGIDPIHKLRSDAAIAALHLLQNDTIKSLQKAGPVIDIGPLYDIVDRALDEVGFRRTFLELFETYSFALATLTAAVDIGAKRDYLTIQINHVKGERPEAVYSRVLKNETQIGPTDRYPGETGVCTGCLPALHHWVGAIAAEKFVNEGSLLLDTTSGKRLRSARDVIAELQRMTREESPPDMVPFHSQHGFLWQYIPTVDHDFVHNNSYPIDTMAEICGPLIWDVRENRTMGIIPKLDVSKECLHGAGHAVYYVVANKQMKREQKEWSARRQLRARGGFVLTDDNLCEAGRICASAPTPRMYHQCRGGLMHAYYEVGYGPEMSNHSKDMLLNHCGLKP